MTISQEKVGKLLERSETPEATEEVLLAYCFSKWMNGGNQAQVLRKLHLLTLYLRAVDMGHVLRQHYQAFAIVASLTKQNSGPIVLLPVTPLGLEAWNAARRPSKSVLKRVFDGKSRGGSGLLSRLQSSGSGSSESSDASEFEEDDSATITPGTNSTTTAATTTNGRNRSQSGGLSSLMSGRRSRSNTVSNNSTLSQTIVVNSESEVGVEARRLAGAGARDGLGRGLLSAPPNYDGNLTSYLASTPNSESSLNLLPPAPPHSPPRGSSDVPLVLRDEVEVLPGYA
ncbi:uncharacterized protein JCM6883_005404 [Sporobolomyces salmoneus]|uniref:uncharacterized protein n=1 Tax=Sporobolomyces salmoneus TaxID=183962 RepID=UPI003181EC53